MTTAPTRGQHRVDADIEQRILAQLAAGASVQQLCQNPNWRIDDVAAVLRKKKLGVDERTGVIVRADGGSPEDPVLVLLTFSDSRYVRERARKVLAARNQLLKELAAAQGNTKAGEHDRVVLNAHNTFIDVLRRELDGAIARTRNLPTGTRKGE